MKKILMVLDHEFPHDIRVEKEAKSLINNGYQVVIACFTKQNRPLKDNYKEIIINRINISEFMHKTHVGCLKFPFYFQFWTKFLNKILKNETFHYIHVHDLPLARVGLNMSKKYHLNYILDLHENWADHLRTARYSNTKLGKLLSNNEQWDKYETEQVLNADKVIVVNEFMKKRIEAGSSRQTGIYTVPNYLDLNFIDLQNSNQNDQKDEQLCLMYLGGIDEIRGIEIVINGYEIFRKRNPHSKVKLRIIGTGNPNYISKLKQLALTKDDVIRREIEFEDPVASHLVFNKLNEADILLLPHVKNKQTDNSSPNKLFEYLYVGKPVVCSNCDSLIPIILENNVGKIYVHDAPEDFASKIQELINENLFEFYAENNKFVVSDRYHWGISEANLLKCYDDINA